MFAKLSTTKGNLVLSITFSPIFGGGFVAFFPLKTEFRCRPGLAAEKFSGVLYPAAVFISCFFILLTLIVFALIRDLRKNLFGKITVGFLVNVFLCYLVLGVRYSVEQKVGWK